MSYVPRENITEGGGGKGPEGTLVWAWNRTDLTQFVDDGANNQFAAGGANGSLSVEVVAERGNVLRYTANGGTTMTEVFLAEDVIEFPDERRDLLIELEYYDRGGPAGGYSGVAFCCDDVGAFHGMIHAAQGVAEWQTLIENDSVIRSSGTGSGTSNGGSWGRYLIRGDKPAGVPPRVSSYSLAWSNDNAVGEPRRTGSNGTRGDVSEFGNNTTLGSTWDDLACDRFGLGIQSSGGNDPPSFIDILDFRVYLVDP